MPTATIFLHRNPLCEEIDLSILGLDVITPKNADFLIKEGEKAKKLAEQYVETA